MKWQRLICAVSLMASVYATGALAHQDDVASPRKPQSEKLGKVLFKTSCTPEAQQAFERALACLLYTSPSPRDRQKSRMPSSA